MAILPILIGAVPIAIALLAKVLPEGDDPESRRRRTLEETPVTPIAELRTGDVAKVRGRVEAYATPLVAPWSERLSVHHQVRGVAWDRVTQRLITLELEVMSVDFWVVDDSGRLLVREGPLARIVLQEQFTSSAGGGEMREAFQARFREQSDAHEVQYALVASLDVGEEIVVHGRIGFDTSVRGVARGYRAAVGVPELLRDGEVERLVSDLPELVG